MKEQTNSLISNENINAVNTADISCGEKNNNKYVSGLLNGSVLHGEPDDASGDKPSDNPDDMLSAIQGRQALGDIITEFETEVFAYWSLSKEKNIEPEKLKVPMRAIKAPAGMGKTQATLDMIQSLLEKNPLARILFLVPSISLGEELKKSAELRPNLPVRLVRGRSQPKETADRSLPENQQEKMCARHKEAEKLSALSLDVKSHLCIRISKEKGVEPNKCPHYDTCPYISQLNQFHGLTIASHSYLTITADWLAKEKIDLVIVDESYWNSLLRLNDISMTKMRDEFFPKEGTTGRVPFFCEMNYPTGKVSEEDRVQAWGDDCDFFALWNARAWEVINGVYGRNRQHFTADDFKHSGITPDIANRMATLEYKTLNKPNIRPDMKDDEIRGLLEKAVVQSVFFYARFWKNLAQELGIRQGKMHSVALRQKGISDRVCLFSHKNIRLQGLPTLVIDADLNKSITQALLPDFADDDFHSLNVSMSDAVKVTQVTDFAISKSSFINGNLKSVGGQKKAQIARNRIFNACISLSFATGSPDKPVSKWNETEKRQKPLLITYKATHDFWKGHDVFTQRRNRNQNNTDVDYDDSMDMLPLTEDGLRFKDENNDVPFDVAYFGNIRGKDGWKDANSIIVCGRNEPTVQAVEDATRAIFYASEENINFSESNLFQKVERKISSTDGEQATVKVSTHPDARCQMVLEQIREAELTQAIGRGRPIHRTRPLEIIVATNVPVPGLRVNRLCKYDDLMKRHNIESLRRGLVPDNPSDAVRLFSDIWTSEGAFTKARQRNTNDIPMILAQETFSQDIFSVSYRTRSMTNRNPDRTATVLVKTETERGSPEFIQAVKNEMQKAFKFIPFEIFSISNDKEVFYSKKVVITEEVEEDILDDDMDEVPVKVEPFKPVPVKMTVKKFVFTKPEPEPIELEKEEGEEEPAFFGEDDIIDMDMELNGPDTVWKNIPVFTFAKYRDYDMLADVKGNRIAWRQTPSQKEIEDRDLASYKAKYGVDDATIAKIWGGFMYSIRKEFLL